jgi:hypothetical protein
MWTPDEITAGNARLTMAKKLTPSDAQTLDGVFRIYLKNRYSSGFSDLPVRMAALTDTDEVKTAAKLVATLILLEQSGFQLSELKGGRSGLQTNKVGEMVLKIRLALSLLGYELPEEFSGAVENGDENVNSSFPFINSVTIHPKIGW